MTDRKLESSIEEKWDSGELGRDEQYVRKSESDIESQINESLDLQLISIRLQKSLIDDFKIIAKEHGIGYQPLMRQTLTRFAECEKKRLLRQFIAERNREERNKSKEKQKKAVNE